MKKLLVIFLVAIFVMGITSVAQASNMYEWIKGNDADEPLITSFYVAKTFELDKEDRKAIRVKLERSNNIGDFSRGLYQISAGLEF